MVRIVFECTENMNEHKEIFEFDDDVTEKEINDEFVDWVWSEVGDRYGWYEEE